MKQSEIPKTLEDFKKIRETIFELMSNPYCDQYMFISLSKKLDKTNVKIEELKNEKKIKLQEESFAYLLKEYGRLSSVLDVSIEDKKESIYQQSAVQWLLDRIEDVDNTPKIWEQIKIKANKMFEQQIIDAHDMGYIDGGNHKKVTAEMYYNETYGSKKE